LAKLLLLEKQLMVLLLLQLKSEELLVRLDSSRKFVG